MTAAEGSDNGTVRRALSSIRGSKHGSGLVPINVFMTKQSEIKSLVSTCIESTSPQQKQAAVKEINHLHQEFDTQTSELQKCLNFYEH